MTIQRYLFRLFWRRLGFPLIAGCGIIALVSTFYHHTLYKRVDAPPNTQHMQPVKNSNLKTQLVLETDVKFKQYFHQKVNVVLGDKNNEILAASMDNEKNQRKSPGHVINLGGNEKDHNQNKQVNQNVYQNKSLKHRLEGFNSGKKLISQKRLLDNSLGDKPAKDVFDRKDYRNLSKSHIKPAENLVRQVHNSQHNASKERIKNRFLYNQYINRSHHDGNLQYEAKDNPANAKQRDNLNNIKQVQYQADNQKFLNNARVARVQVDGEYRDIVIRNNKVSDVKTTVLDRNFVSLPKDPPEFRDWEQSKAEMCEGNFQAYYNEFVLLKDVIVDRNFFKGKSGGEDIQTVINQPEESEYYQYDMGCFQLKCTVRPDYFFYGGRHLADFLFYMQTKPTKDPIDEIRNRFTLVVVRYEYANIYHQMTDFYNAYIVMRFFNETLDNTDIVIIDSHPKGALDTPWGVMFGSVQRLSQLKMRTQFARMVWSIIGYESLLLSHFLESVPLINEFHQDFLKRYKIKPSSKLDCDNVKILFIWRRDYLAHPRNPSGKLSRKIKNEKELLTTLQRKHPQFHIQGVQIDLFTFEQQLQLIANTDILIGMHGAGLTHTLFLPKHAGLIELIPNYWTAAMDHFMALAQWRGLLYERWVNRDPHDEVPNDSSHIPTEVIAVLVKSTLRKMECITETSMFEE